MIRRVASLIPHDGAILDVGCGSGEGLLVLREDPSREGRLLACDLSPEFLRIARRRVVKCGLFASDAESLGVRSASCAAALSFGVLGHLLDPTAALGELARVVRPGGFIAIWTRTEGRLSRVVVFLFERINPGNRFCLHEPQVVRRILENRGVNVLSEERVAGGCLWIGRRERA